MRGTTKFARSTTCRNSQFYERESKTKESAGYEILQEVNLKEKLPEDRHGPPDKGLNLSPHSCPLASFRGLPLCQACYSPYDLVKAPQGKAARFIIQEKGTGSEQAIGGIAQIQRLGHYTLYIPIIMDMRPINATTVTDEHLKAPLQDTPWEVIEDAKFFTELDMRDDYHRLWIRKGDEHLI